jgi:Tol biopolymer transport system component
LLGSFWASVVAMVAMSAVPEEAQAAFPGKNGKIVFQSNQDGDYDIYTVSPTGDNPKPLTNNSKNDRSPAWSPDGRKIVFSSGYRSGSTYPPPYSEDIFVMNARGSGLSRVTDERSISGTLKGDDSSPGFSPNGRKIVFVRSKQNNPDGDIYKIGADGKNLTRLTRFGDGYFPCCPAWSPDGSKIAYSVWDGYSDSMETMNPDGSSQQSFFQELFQEGHGPDWSPDGSQVVFSRYGDIYKMDADGTDETPLTTSEAYDSFPSFSPDGSKIVFQSAADGNVNNYDLYIMDANGNNLRPLTNDPAQEMFPDWRPVQ